MKRSAPLRRTGFKSRSPAPVQGLGIAAPGRRAPIVTPGLFRRPVAVSGMVLAVPKSEPRRNPHLLAMARDEACLLRVPDICNGDRSTTVACHSNLAEHGKAGARKADDCWSVWGCRACHAWLDQGPASYEDKRDQFLAAHQRMTAIWLGIVAGMQPASPKDRAAAQWALAAANERCSK